MRWFTATAWAQRDAQGHWEFVPTAYLAVDQAAVIVQVRSTRPDEAVIIHDLGHVLVAPPRLIRAERMPRDATPVESWLNEEIAKGGGILMASPKARASGLEELARARGLSVIDEADLARENSPRRLYGFDFGTEMVGSLSVNEPFDAAVWDLDRPELSKMSVPEACRRAWLGDGVPVKEIWLRAMPVFAMRGA